MGWLLVLTLATAIPASPPAPSVSGFMDGAQLNALCNARQPDAEASAPLCLGYIAGSVDQLLARQARRPTLQRTICLPKNLPVDELADVVAKHLRRFPQVRSFAASAVVRQALEVYYPCKPQPDVGRP